MSKPATTVRGPEAVLHAVITAVRTRLPQGITPTYFDNFIDRNRQTLLAMLRQKLGAPRDLPPDEWTPARRTRANLAAMELLAPGRLAEPTDEDRALLSRYSGWGGLSIESVRDQIPSGVPSPDPRGLIHEYYTPTRVAQEIARTVRPLLNGLLSVDGTIPALEPAAGIGRLLRPMSGPGFEAVSWTAVEWSPLSARMLAASFPELEVFEGPFERWTGTNDSEVRGTLKLLVANPPYGSRGAAVADDPVRNFREKRAYAYFLRRGLDLLAAGGLGVFLVPAGFLTGRSVASVKLRSRVLRISHLAAAYRLPSRLFPGAHLVTDLVFFRGRGGRLREVLQEDQFIVDGSYFGSFPDHVLGTEIGKDRGGEDQTKKPRFRYEVRGEFTNLPDLVERPVCDACVVPNASGSSGRSRGPRRGLARGRTQQAELPPQLASAVALGHRVDRYLALLAGGESETPALLWTELHSALTAWRTEHGSPHRNVELRKLAQSGDTGAGRLLAAFSKSGSLLAALTKAPVHRPVLSGKPNDITAQAELLFRSHRKLTVIELMAGHRGHGGTLRNSDALTQLTEAGWCLDGAAWSQLVPRSHYLTGHLWPKLQRAQARAKSGDEQAVAQAQALLEAIEPAVFEDIDQISPRQGWLPLQLVSSWMTETLNHGSEVTLVRQHGLVQLQGAHYDDLKAVRLLPEARWVIGWINHDRVVFKPRKRRDQKIDEIRLQYAARWDASFHAWAATAPERRAKIEEAYNRQFRGYVPPTFSAEPLPIARWTQESITLHPYQVAGARRLLANRGGLLAFDVGVGKTYTALAVLARARQDGWCSRPVIVVPNSIIWKWEADIRRVLPDYRIGVVGSRRKVLTRGSRRGQVTSETDTPTERARTWTAFQAGQFDVVLLTYSALGRTRMNESALRAYADKTEAIRREIALRQRNARSSKRMTERQKAILKEGVAAWIAEKLEIPSSWEYDPGIAWDELGIDLLIIDEAQNFKNLYMPEAREGGVPRFMGSAGTGSNRAWQLDFRCSTVRARTGGAGIALLSATPAKNSPLEFYNLIQFVDHEAWASRGIRDPEQFIDRYLRIALQPVVNTKMDIEERSAVVGFQSLHELRDVIFRYGEFKTAADVGLKLPEPRVEIVEVDLDEGQEDKYRRYVGQIESALQSTQASDRGKILGLLARMALVAIHAELDEGHTWSSAADPDLDPASPKFEALAERIVRQPGCGHIVFVDNLAAHRWVVRVLTNAGLSRKRIAVLNARTAKAAADRQRIAQDFNGEPEAGLAPKYDVVIANAIAYEGIDLQRRTCAIHHLDLPWEPATLQQRNGRGVRQGNQLESVAINYYFARRSQDGLRFNLIQGKLGWMTELLQSQARDTNNPGAQMELGPEELLLLVSRDPDKTRERLAGIKAKREAEARAKAAGDAARLLRSINARFRKAERATDPTDGQRLRLEAEQRLQDLARTDPAAWPWMEHAVAVRQNALLVPNKGAVPVFEGMRTGVPVKWSPDRTEFVEFGQIHKTSIGVREAGSSTWTTLEFDKLAELGVEPAHLALPWPADDEELLRADLVRRVSRIGGDWTALGWTQASDAFAAAAWKAAGAEIVSRLGQARGWYSRQQRVPLLASGRLSIGSGPGLSNGKVLEPTRAGWKQFLQLAPASGQTWSKLAEAAQYWWGKTLPRDALSTSVRAA